jgi:DNA-binding transcriptional MocR family regulator
MAWQHIHIVRQLELPHIDKLILFALASRVDETGQCWPSIETLRKDTGLAHRTVQYHLGALVDRGIVVREERRGATTILRLRLTPTCIGASSTPVQSDAASAQRMHFPMHGVHERPAQPAPELRKELPSNRHEQPRDETETTTAKQSQVGAQINRLRAAISSWWTTRPGIEAKGRALGIPPRPGEDYGDYKERLFAAERAAQESPTTT